ncbi:MAG: hypothetical protein K2Y23_05525 [Cyanobacteria bacterium]|nr:hypothetical protein [Cyanobacteriota bacterium]
MILALAAPDSRLPVPGMQELLDRTLALVGGQPITLSDTRAALALGLIAPGAAAPDGDATAQLIRRELILREVQRYAPAAPSESAVEARLAEIRKRFPAAATLARVLEAHAFSETRLRTWVRDDLRTEAYLAQRFASASTPTDAEISTAYARSKAEFDRSNTSFEQAAPIIRDRLIAARRVELISDWVSDLRRRTEVVILQQ